MPAGPAEHSPFGAMQQRKERMEGSVLGQWNELEPTAALTARDTMGRAMTDGVRQAMGPHASTTGQSWGETKP